jgi:hypothetical protein
MSRLPAFFTSQLASLPADTASAPRGYNLGKAKSLKTGFAITCNVILNAAITCSTIRLSKKMFFCFCLVVL